MNKEIAEILLADWQNKKQFKATWSGDCDNCGQGIEQDEEFVFYGSKQKLCNDCSGKIESTLENIVETG